MIDEFIFKVLKAIDENKGISINKLYKIVKGNRTKLYNTVNNLNLLGLVAKIEYRPNNGYPYYYKPIHKLSLTPKGKEVLNLLNRLKQLLDGGRF